MYLKCLDKFQELVLPTKNEEKYFYQYMFANTEFSRYRPMFALPQSFRILSVWTLEILMH